MAFKKGKGFNFRVMYTILGLSLVMALVVTAANGRVSVDGRAASNETGSRRIPTRVPTRRPTVTPRPTTTVTPTPTTQQLNFYLRTTEEVNASPGVASTVVVGCDAGDIALSAGIENYGGPLNKWRTIRSTPSTSTDMNGFLVTVLNEDTVSHPYTITTKCLKK